MPNLGDFLGSLIGEMAVARLRADEESVRIADLYAAHDLLKHFPVPRFRLPELRVDIPVLLEGDSLDAASAVGRLDARAARDALAASFDDAAIETSFRLSDTTRKKTLKSASKMLERELASDPQPSMRQLADRIVGEISQATAESDVHAMSIVPRVRDELRRNLLRRLNLARAGSARIRVVPTTSSVREVPDGDRLVRLQLSLTEDAMEWMVIDTAAGTENRLTPE